MISAGEAAGLRADLLRMLTHSLGGRPTLASENLVHGVGADSVACLQFSGCYPVCPVIPHCRRESSAHFRIGIALPCSAATSSFNMAIPIVVSAGAKPKVGRVTTGRVVACVQHAGSFGRDCSECKSIRDDVGEYQSSPVNSAAESPVPVDLVGQPRPAIIRPSPVNLGPEPFGQRASRLGDASDVAGVATELSAASANLGLECSKHLPALLAGPLNGRGRLVTHRGFTSVVPFSRAVSAVAGAFATLHFTILGVLQLC